MLNSERVQEMMALFATVLPRTGDTKQNAVLEKRFGMSVDEFVRLTLMQLALDIVKTDENKEIAEGYFNFISDAILYMKEERDDYPEIEITDIEDLSKLET